MYLEVKNSLELIGGKWKGGKVYGFVFTSDPSELLAQVAGGEKGNLKKEFQFFETPDKLADRLVALAGISEDDRVLEPSAGQGAIINAINRVHPYMVVDCFELMDVNRTVLFGMDKAVLIGTDFMDIDTQKEYADNAFDVVVANPPFSKNQDIDHVRKMYEYTKSPGRIVTIMSNHWRSSSNKKETEFRAWLYSQRHDIYEIEAGEFKESGTSIAACIVVIEK